MLTHQTMFYRQDWPLHKKKFWQELQEIKHANSSAKLASKHVILSTTISAGPTSSMRNIAKVLGVHCQNIDIVMQRHNITSDTCDALWSLSVRNRRIDGCTVGAKMVCLYLVGIKDTNESQQRSCDKKIP